MDISTQPAHNFMANISPDKTHSLLTTNIQPQFEPVESNNETNQPKSRFMHSTSTKDLSPTRLAPSYSKGSLNNDSAKKSRFNSNPRHTNSQKDLSQKPQARIFTNKEDRNKALSNLLGLMTNLVEEEAKHAREESGAQTQRSLKELRLRTIQTIREVNNQLTQFLDHKGTIPSVEDQADLDYITLTEQIQKMNEVLDASSYMKRRQETLQTQSSQRSFVTEPSLKDLRVYSLETEPALGGSTLR